MIETLHPSVYPIALLLQAAVTMGLAGIAWYRLLVHLPLLRRVGRYRLARYVLPMETLELFIITPLLLVETLAAFVVLLAAPQRQVPSIYPLAGVALLVLIWILQLAVARPQLRALTGLFSARGMRALLCASWVQAVAWTLRGAIALMLLLFSMRA